MVNSFSVTIKNMQSFGYTCEYHLTEVDTLGCPTAFYPQIQMTSVDGGARHFEVWMKGEQTTTRIHLR
jgi:hypothetical protein